MFRLVAELAIDRQSAMQPMNTIALLFAESKKFE
jgi:hypothetical protein